MQGGGPLEEILKNLARLLTSQGPLNMEMARQLAQMTASEGQSEPNPDPLARVRLEELLRVADLNVSETTGLTTAPLGGLLSVQAVTRSDWAVRTLDAWRPILEKLAASLGRVPDADVPDDDGPADLLGKVLGNLPQAMAMVAPLIFGMQTGTMVGHLATRAMGQYDLPVPRPPKDTLLMVPTTIDSFAQEWSLPIDDVRLWVCLHEVAHHAVLSRPHVRARLDELMTTYVSSFQANVSAFEEHLSGFDLTDMSSLQQTFADPEVLLGQLETPAQREVMVPLQALLSAVVGYVDHIMDTVGQRLIGAYRPLTEALRRRRLEVDDGTRFVARMLGISLDSAAYDRGAAFVKGVLERAGEPGLARLWQSAKELPTPAEIAAPGLWLARIDLPDA